MQPGDITPFIYSLFTEAQQAFLLLSNELRSMTHTISKDDSSNNGPRYNHSALELSHRGLFLMVYYNQYNINWLQVYRKQDNELFLDNSSGSMPMPTEDIIEACKLFVNKIKEELF